jgi:hypothetical protein
LGLLLLEGDECSLGLKMSGYGSVVEGFSGKTALEGQKCVFSSKMGSKAGNLGIQGLGKIMLRLRNRSHGSFVT